MKQIPLTQGKVALVDDADYERASPYSWYACYQRGRWYALRMIRVNGKRKPLALHQFIMGVRYGYEIDHRDGDGLNNQKENLRHVCRGHNNANQKKQIRATSSRFKGVTWDKRTGKWIAQIQASKKHFFLGRFESEQLAAKAYNSAASRCFGEYARVNSI